MSGDSSGSGPAAAGSTLVWLLLILGLTLGIYAPSLQNDFVFDDRFAAKSTVADTGKPHEMISTLQPLTTYFSSHYLRGGGDSRGFRPITVLSMALVYQIFGKGADNEALPQRVVNLFLQVLNTLFVFLLIRSVCGRNGPSLWGALIFGVHAIHTGVLGSIIGRGELLAFAFGAAASLVFLGAGHRQASSVPSGGLAIDAPRLAGTAVLLFCAMCSKESAVPWLVFLPLLQMARCWMRGEPLRVYAILGRAALVSLVPVISFGLLFWLATKDVHYQPDYVGNPLYYESVLTRVAAGVTLSALALYKIVAPFALCCDYGPNVLLPEQLVGTTAVLSGIILAILLGVAAFGARRWPLLFLAAASFFGFWFTTSNIPFALETIFAERLLYTPSLCTCFLVAGIMSVRSPLIRKIIAGGLTLWCLANIVVVWQRIPAWRDNDTLFATDLEQRPESLRLLIASITMGQKNLGEAAVQAYYERALQVEPEFPMALGNLGVARLKAGDVKGATDLFERGLRSRLLDKGFRRDEGAKMAYNLGVVHHGAGRLREAAGCFAAAVEWSGAQADPRRALLRMLWLLGDLRALQAHVAAALQADPKDPVFHMFYGLFLARSGDPGQAAQILERVLPQIPGGTATLDDWLELAECLLAINHKERARAVMREATDTVGTPSPQQRARIDGLQRRLAR